MSVGIAIAGRYEIFRLLGRGGMGDVFAATDLQLERRVALKAIRREFRLDPASRARFLREARALSKLEHASICRIYDYVSYEDQDYLVLELIEGASLRERITDGLDRASAFRFAEQIADALGVAHAEGLVHRDLKPTNVMITAEGVAKILDFGLARSTTDPAPAASSTERPATLADVADLEGTMSAGTLISDASSDSITVIGHAVGTPLYMSPEQARGEEVGAPSDMFSFGLLLHEMFTGSRAYQGGDRDELSAAIAAGKTARVHGLEHQLTDLIERLKSPARSRRPTAVDAAGRLAWIRGRPQRRLRWAGVALLALIAIASGVKYTLDLRRERAAAQFRRSQSDAHIEFMVEELYKKLEPVGNVEILEEVGNRALDYFETLSEREKTDEDRARFGRTMAQIGHVRLNLGDLDGAAEAFTRSLEIHQKLVAVDPTNSRWQIGLTGAHFGLGNVAWFQDDLERAGEEFRTYLQIAQAQLEREPKNQTHQLEVGYALTNLVAWNEAMGNAARAIELSQQALAIKQRLVAGDPENRDYLVSLARTYGYLGETLQSEGGDLREALNYFIAELEIRRKLAADRRDANAQRGLAVSLHHVGVTQERLGNSVEAERAYVDDLRIAQQLVGSDPANLEWRRELSVSRFTLGQLLVHNQRYSEARPLLTSALDEITELVEIGDESIDWKTDRVSLRRALAQLELSEGRAARALEILREIPSLDDPVNLSRDLILTGNAYLAQGNSSAAARVLRRAEEILRPMAEHSTNIELLLDWADLLKLLNKQEELESLLTRLAKSGYRRI